MLKPLSPWVQPARAHWGRNLSRCTLAACFVTAPSAASAGAKGPSVQSRAPEVKQRRALKRAAPLVKVRQGWLRGVSDEERAPLEGQRRRRTAVDEFLSIPFAAPPVGERRFRPPEPPARWRGVRDAREISGLCAQPFADSSEDCLYLNVYTPRVANGPVPVLLYLHGGGLMVGSAAEFRARKLASEMRAVVVTTNYRLNVLGFLNLASPATASGEPAAASLPGNYALLDQQQALRWVHDNVARFGGDPERVTIAGHSAGATSVCAHMVAPASRGAFVGAVMASGVCPIYERSELEQRGGEFTARVGCAAAEDPVACLRGKSTAELFAALGDYQADFGIDPTLLPRSFDDAITHGELASVPTLLGWTHDEARIFFSDLFPLAPELYPVFAAGQFGPLASEVIARYPAEAEDDPLYAFSAAASDAGAHCSGRRLAARLSTVNDTYLYEFDDPNAPAPHWMPVPPGLVMGSTHSSDAPYWFDRAGLVQPDAPPFDDAQLALGREIRRTLGAFVWTGNPNPRGGAFWPKYEPSTDLVMLMEPGGLNAVTDHAESHQCDFWDSTVGAPSP